MATTDGLGAVGGLAVTAQMINKGTMALHQVVHAAWAHAPAVGVLAFLFVLGMFAVDGYGLHVDYEDHRGAGRRVVEYLLGENMALHHHEISRCYGVVFEVARWMVERTLGVTDYHDIYRSGYVFSHGFFLVGAFACYLLAARLFKSRAIALLAMLFLVCHPRLYGHSFFNNKDIPFLSMFMIGLLLAHWALLRGGVGAFATAGAWLGLAGTVRPMALLLLGLVALARCADLFRAGASERIRVIASLGAFAALAAGGYFAGLPYVWGDPLPRISECLTLMSSHSTVKPSFFLGELIKGDVRPLSYVPVWAGVTMPPFVIVLALIGGLALCARLVARPLAVLHDATLRFQVLLAACVLATVAVVTFMVGSIYDDWRHLYFLCGPLCLGAAGGLAWLCRNAARTMAALARAVAAVGIMPLVAWAAILHPHQHVYFNFLVDRKTPERLRGQFDLDHTRVPFKEALEVLLKLEEGHAEQIPILSFVATSANTLPAEARKRFVVARDFSAYFIYDYRAPYGRGPDLGPTYVEPVHVRKVFSNTLYALARAEVEAAEGTRYREDYLAALSNPPTASGRFSLHWDGMWLTYIRKDCEPADVNFGRVWGGGELFLKGEWRDPPGRYDRSYSYPFRHRGVVFQEGQSRVCMARVPWHHAEPFIAGQWGADGTSGWVADVKRGDSSEDD